METGVRNVPGSGSFLHVVPFHLVLDLHVVVPFHPVVLDLHAVHETQETSDLEGDLPAQSLVIELRNLEVGLHLNTLLNSLQVNRKGNSLLELNLKVQQT